MAKKSLDDLLNSEPGSEETARTIHDCYREQVRKFLGRSIPRGLQVTADITELVETAIRRAIDLAKRKPEEIRNSKHMTRLIFGIADKVKSDRLRKMGTAKRGKHTIRLGSEFEELLSTTSTDDPASQIELSDLANVLIAELKEEKNESQGLANVALLQGFTVPEVQEMLRRLGLPVPSDRTMRMTLQRKLAYLRTKYRNDGHCDTLGEETA